MIVVAIIGLLAAIAIPNYVKIRTNSHKSTCLANLKQIANAKATWAMEQNKNTADTPNSSDIFGPAAYITDEPKCPATDTPYVLQKVDQNPTCAIAAHNP